MTCPFHLLIFIFCCSGFLVSSAGEYTRRPSAQSTQESEFQTSPAECGVYAVLAAANSLGKKIDPTNVSFSKYVSSINGSTGQDLIKAARDFGFEARGIQNLNAAYLRKSEYPVVLNLKPLGSPNDCSGHWVTFLGDENGKAVIFDNLSNEKEKLVSYSELLTEMSSNGVVVSPRGIPGSVNRLFSWVGSCFLFLIGTTVVLTVGIFFKAKYNSRVLWQFAGVVSCSILFATCWVWLHSENLVRNKSVAAWIESSHISKKFQSVSYKQLKSFMKRDDVVLVDSRSQEAFEYGRIPGSICISVHLNYDEFTEKAESIDKQDCIIVYCNNEQCSYSKIMAQRLTAIGCKDVRVYSNGLEEYAGLVSDE